jgi:hypothetical protein
MSSYTDDGAAEMTWPRYDVDESCWWQCCRVMLAIVLLSPASDGVAESAWQRCCRVLLVTVLLSPTDDGTIDSCWWQHCWVLSSPFCDGATEVMLVVVQCCCQGDLAMVWCHCWVMLVMSLPRRLSHGAMSLLSHAVRPESGSTTGAMMCD